jgi:hypothetical protein
MRWTGRTMLLGLIGLVAAGADGCSASRTELYGPDDPLVRIPRMKQAVEDQDLSVLPKLIDELASRDPAIRLFAISSLERLTGQRLGFVYYDSVESRAEAMQRWRAWLTERQGGAPSSERQPPASQPATEPSDAAAMTVAGRKWFDSWE